jgi:hypothetical protein
VTGTLNINASGNSTFQFGGSTQMTINTSEVSIPDLKTTVTSEATTGTFVIQDAVTSVNIRQDVSFLGDASARHSLTNVGDIDATTGTIATFDCTTASIPTETSGTDFTTQPTITLGGNAGDILDTYRFPNVINGDASNDGVVNFNINLQGNYIYLKQPTANDQWSGIVIKRDKAGAASLPSDGKFISFDTDGYAEQCGDNDSPVVGIKIGDDAASSMYILTNGYYRMATGDNTANTGKVIYKSTTGGYTFNPSSMTYAQAIGTMSKGDTTWTEFYINTSNVIVET